jgi:antitoxin VapB
MNLVIKNDEAQKLATRLAQVSGESVESVVVAALREKAERDLHTARPDRRGIAEQLMHLGAQSASWPDKDTRTAEEILGYDENGLPT